MTSETAPPDRMQELLAIMARLRAVDGCPWDREQTFATIAPHTIEEAYEVADAVERGDVQHLTDELGDLLFQVVFQAQIASETRQFDFQAVAGAICGKLIRRHPHVFGASGPLTPAEQSAAWEDIKAAERRAAAPETASHLDGVPPALPALARAYKLSKRAARVGFDFENPNQTADKVAEELAEVRDAAAQRELAGAAAAAGAAAHIFEEIGDLLFAAANLARKLEVDPEAALRSANAKFERRFSYIERALAAGGRAPAQASLAEMDALWNQAKAHEKGEAGNA